MRVVVASLARGSWANGIAIKGGMAVGEFQPSVVNPIFVQQLTISMGT